MALDMAALDEILRRHYLPMVRELFDRDTLLLQRLQRGPTTVDFAGNRWTVAQQDYPHPRVWMDFDDDDS